jgi:hypothetical protein
MTDSVLSLLIEPDQLEEVNPFQEQWEQSRFFITEMAKTRPEKAILQRIAFWQSKAKTIRDNEIWIVKSAAEFRAEGVDYEDDTIRRAIRRLVKIGVLVTERHFHPYRHTMGPVLWIRPTLPIEDDTKRNYCKKKAMASDWS